MGDLPQVSIESRILSGIIVDNDKIIEIMEVVSPEMFTLGAHSSIYKIMLRMFENKIRIDGLSLWNEVLRYGYQDSILTEQYVDNLSKSLNIPFLSETISSYAQILRDNYIANTAKDTVFNLYTDLKEGNLSTEKIFSKVQECAIKICDVGGSGVGGTQQVGIDLADIEASIDRKIECYGVTGLETGVTDFDLQLDGLQNEKVYACIASNGVGKTALAIQTALHNAKKGKRVFYGSYEMPCAELSLRLIFQEMNLNSDVIENPREFIDGLIGKGTVNNIEEGKQYIKDKLKEGREIIEKLPIYIHECQTPTIDKFLNALDKFSIQHGKPDLVCCDHSILLLSSTEPSFDELYKIYKRFKNAAKKHKCPFLVLHQFKSNVGESKNRYPSIFQIAYVQALTDNTDVLFFIFRPEVFDDLLREDPSLKGVCSFVIGKKRYGRKPIGDIPVDYNGVKFTNRVKIGV